METSPNTQAILLLTTHFAGAGASGGAEKPLTPKEWGRFAEWLKSRALTPARLLQEDPNALLEEWRDKTVSIARIKTLLNRGMALSMSMDKWLGAGLWIMTRSDADYPSRLKKRLGNDSPAVLFGCGRRALLSGGGIAVVGSRNACPSDIDYSRRFGALVSQSGRSVVSGGARGVDEAAMLGSLEAEGTAVGVMADNLLRACTSEKYRRHLAANNLALVSPFNPEAPFNAGNAMQRNKYIYCLSDLALVVHTGREGGTWSGAMENLRKKWVPLRVKHTGDRAAGNADLIGKGAAEAPATAGDIVVERLFDACSNARQADSEAPVKPAADPVENAADARSFYRIFLDRIQPKCANEPQTPDDLADYFGIDNNDISKTQLNAWLKRAVSDGQVKKLKNPVRYQWMEQGKIF